MKKITAYQLSNGDIIENEAEAIRKENALIFQKKLTQLVEENVSYTDRQRLVINFINENTEDLKELFNLLK